MPPRRGVRLGGPRGRSRSGGRYREIPLEDVVSQQREAPRVERANEEVEQNEEPPAAPGVFAREFVAALAEANMLRTSTRAEDGNRAMDAMREFRRLNPPLFGGECGDFLAADYWLSEINKLFDALDIVEDNIRVKIVACQLTGEANEWWKSVLESRKDARRAARRAAGTNEPDRETLTWADFEVLFENQYFPESYRDQLREQFETLEQGNMTVSEYAARFQTLSRFAPELVASESRKCRRFERGLHSSVKRLVVSQRKMNFVDVVECARSVELPKEAQRGSRVWEPRQPSTVPNYSSSSGSSGSQGRKRQREQFQFQRSHSNLRPAVTSGSRSTTSRPPSVCFRCNQPGHIRAQCPVPPKVCYTCGKEDHISKFCPQGGGTRSEVGSVQQPRQGQGQQSHGAPQRQQQPHFCQTTSV
jgi:hypothetical protein